MNKLMKKLSTLIVGFAMAIGVGAAISGVNVKGANAGTTVTYTHDFTAKPSGSGDITLSDITWQQSNASGLNNYNSGNYKGVQLGTSSATGSYTLTSKYAWGEQTGTSFKGKTVVKNIYLWMNAGAAGSITATVSVGGNNVSSDGTKVAKNSSAASQRSGTTKVTYTPSASNNTGIIVISYSKATAKQSAGYFCSIQIECEEPAASKFTVSYNKGSGSGTNTSVTVDAGQSTTLPSSGFSKDHYSLDGWSTAQDSGTIVGAPGASYTPTSDITLYAHYAIAEHSVTYKKGSGTGPADTTVYVNVGESTTLPSSGYSKDHCTFDGWSTEQDSGTIVGVPGASYTPTSDIILYAHYTVSEYVITYNANSGSGSHENDVVTKGQSVTLPDSGFSKTGYTFDGWATSPTGAKAYDLGGSCTPTSDVTLYAHYTILSFSITSTYIKCEGLYEEPGGIGYGGTLYDYIEPNEGYHLPSQVAVSVNGEAEPRMVSINEDGELETTNITGNVTYTVEAIINCYSVTGNIANGSLTGDSNVNHGSPYSGKIEANTDFHLPDSISVTIDGSSLSNFTYSAETGDIEIAGEYVLGDIEITATCYMVYAIDASRSVGGSVDSAKSDSNIRSGGTASIYFVPSEGYILPPDSSEEYFRIENAEINNYNPETGCLTIGNPTGTVSIVCNFVELGYRDITLVMDNVTSTGTGEDAIEIGGSATVTIEANTGYRLPSESDFEVEGADAAFAFAGNKNVTITLTNCISDVTITATCVKQYSVTVNVTNGTSTQSSQVVDEGSQFSTTVSPNTDYKLPSSISVTKDGSEATQDYYSYNFSNGQISVSSVTGTTVINVSMVALSNYNVFVSTTNVTKVSGPDTIQERGSATYVFSANNSAGYYLPDSVSVDNASYTWTKASGTLVISNPTGVVSISVVADKDELTSITLSAYSGTYTLGDEFVMPTVTAHYKYKGNADVTSSATFSGYDPYTIGVKTVTISYTEDEVEKTADYTATVNAKSIQTDTIWTRITSVAELTAGTYIIGYEATAGSRTIVPLRSGDYATTLTKNGIFNTGTTAGSTTGETITIATNMSSTDYEFTIEVISAGVINIKGSDGNYLGTSEGGTSKNTGRIYDSGNSNETNFSLEYNNNKFSMTASNVSGEYKYLKYNTSSPRYACYNTKSNDTSFYKKSTQSTGTASLIRIVCDPQIDPATGYKGGQKYIGDYVSISDFVVKKQLDTGDDLFQITDFTINGGTEVTLTDPSNTITISYTDENGTTKTCNVVVTAEERTAEVVSVELVEGESVERNYYIREGEQISWNYTDLSVLVTWSDGIEESHALADLVERGDATIDPEKPSIGVKSFSVSCEFDGVPIDENSVSVTVSAKRISSISWTDRFKDISLDVFDGTIINKNQFGVISAKYNDDTNVENFSIDNCTVQLIKNNEVQKTITFDNDGNYAISLADNGCWIRLIAEEAKSKHQGNVDITVTELLNPINKEVEGPDVTSSITFSEQGWGNESVHNEVDIDSHISLSKTGGKDLKYYNSGLSLRAYAGTTFTISGDDKTISKIVLQFGSGGDSNAVTTNVGTYTSGVWTGTANSVAFTIGGTSGHRRIAKIDVTYKTGKIKADIANKNVEAQKKVIEFSNYLMDTMESYCKDFNIDDNFKSAWGLVQAKYNTLFGTSSTDVDYAIEMLKYATPKAKLTVDSDILQNAMARYDLIVSRDSSLKFITRDPSVLSPYTNSSNKSLFTQMNSTMIVVAVVSLLSVTAIGGYFYIRKRKETN